MQNSCGTGNREASNNGTQPLNTITAQGKPFNLSSSSQRRIKLTSGMAEQVPNSDDSRRTRSIHFSLAQLITRMWVLSNSRLTIVNLPSSRSLPQLNSITDNVLSFTADDLIVRRNQIVDFATSISAALGGGNATYNTALKGLPPPPKNFRTLSVDDINLLAALNEIRNSNGQVHCTDGSSLDRHSPRLLSVLL